MWRARSTCRIRSSTARTNAAACAVTARSASTPRPRIKLYSTIFQQFNDDPLPYYEEPQYSPLRTPELLGEYPFVLTTGARPYAFFHPENCQIPFCRELNPDPIVEINPKTAAKLGIMDGQWVEIYNQFGTCKEKAKITETVDENTIHAQHAWWFPEEDGSEPNLYGNFRSNINNLVPNFHFGKLAYVRYKGGVKGKISDAIGSRRKILIFCMVSAVLFGITVFWITDMMLYVVVIILNGFVGGGVAAMLWASSSEVVPSHLISGATAALACSQSVGMFLGSMFMGNVINAVGFTMSGWIVLAPCFFIGLLVAIFCLKGKLR